SKGDFTPVNAIEYIYLTDSSGSIHKLLYPYSLGSREGYAKINYRPLKYGKIDSELFVKTFLHPDGGSNHVPLIAEGIIIGTISDTTIYKNSDNDSKESKELPYRSIVTKEGITYIQKYNTIY
ncbi:MAG: hypothetical protein ACP5N1_01510, partial [Candidatus Woesearchaeota archaeon]